MDREGKPATLYGWGHMKIRSLGIISNVAPNAPLHTFFSNGRIDRRVIGRGECQGCAGKMVGPEGFVQVLYASNRCINLRAHNRHLGASLQEASDFACGNLATSDHHTSFLPQIQSNSIAVGHRRSRSITKMRPANAATIGDLPPVFRRSWGQPACWYRRDCPHRLHQSCVICDA